MARALLVVCEASVASDSRLGVAKHPYIEYSKEHAAQYYARQKHFISGKLMYTDKMQNENDNTSG